MHFNYNMKSINCKVQYLIILIFFIAFCAVDAYAQEDTTIVARVALLIKKVPNGDPIAAVSVTLTNTSDKDIYIPEIFKRFRDWPINARLKTFVMKDGKYVPDGNYGRTIPEPRSDGFPPNYVTGTRNPIIDKYDYIGKNKAEAQDAILKEFAKKNTIEVKRIGLEPLFLKAHESYEINLIKDVNHFVNLPYNFKIFYEMDYRQKSLFPYPDDIMGYKLYLPKKIVSNVIYVQPEP